MLKSYVMSATVANNIALRTRNDSNRGIRESFSNRCFLNRKPYKDKKGNLCIRTTCCNNHKNCSEARGMI